MRKDFTPTGESYCGGQRKLDVSTYLETTKIIKIVLFPVFVRSDFFFCHVLVSKALAAPALSNSFSTTIF